MFSTCSELTPPAPIPDGRMAQIMQPCLLLCSPFCYFLPFSPSHLLHVSSISPYFLLSPFYVSLYFFPNSPTSILPFFPIHPIFPYFPLNIFSYTLFPSRKLEVGDLIHKLIWWIVNSLLHKKNVLFLQLKGSYMRPLDVAIRLRYRGYNTS